jgi:nardilysin
MIMCRIASKLAHSSALNAALTDLLVRVMKDMLQEQLYLASMASLDLIISSKDIAIDLSISGFSDKAPDLLMLGLELLFNYSEAFTAPLVIRQAELLARAYSNTALTASATVDESRICAFKRDSYSSEEKRSAISEILAANESLVTILQQFREEFIQHVSIEILVQGNLSYTRSQKIAEDIIKMSISRNISISTANYPEQVISLVPTDKTLILRSSPKSLTEENIAVELIFQLGVYDLYQLTMLQLLDQILYEPFFDTLRTREQLGYSVSCGARDNFGVLEFYFSIVSSSHSINDVLKALSEYIRTVPQSLSSMKLSDADMVPGRSSKYIFLDQIKSQIDLKLRPDPTLEGAAKLNWRAIKSRRYNFDRLREQVSILISKSCLVHTNADSWTSNISLNKLEEFRRELILFSENLFLKSGSRKLIILQSSATFSKPDHPLQSVKANNSAAAKKKAKLVKSKSDILGLETSQVFYSHKELHSILPVYGNQV